MCLGYETFDGPPNLRCSTYLALGVDLAKFAYWGLGHGFSNPIPKINPIVIERQDLGQP
jgi:hypothetical protein